MPKFWEIYWLFIFFFVLLLHGLETDTEGRQLFINLVFSLFSQAYQWLILRVKNALEESQY